MQFLKPHWKAFLLRYNLKHNNLFLLTKCFLQKSVKLFSNSIFFRKRTKIKLRRYVEYVREIKKKIRREHQKIWLDVLIVEELVFIINICFKLFFNKIKILMLITILIILLLLIRSSNMF